MGNSGLSGNVLAGEVIRVLQGRLPEGWQTRILKTRARKSGAPAPVDAIVTVRRPGTPAGVILVEARNRVEPRDIDYLAATLRPTPNQPVLIAAPFLSPRTQERLRGRGFAYADLTGNIRLSLSEPGLFIETTGASENPDPIPRERKSLKGPKAGRLVRALCDFRPPVGLPELARRAGVDPGYASRVVEKLRVPPPSTSLLASLRAG